MTTRSTMLQPWDIVAIVCLVTFVGTLTGMALWFRFRAVTDQRLPRRRQWLHQSKSRRPHSIQDALEQLYTVTERKSHCDYQVDCDDTECPICLSSFSRVSVEDTSQRGSEVDLEAGPVLPRTIMTITAGISRLAPPARRKKRRSLQPMNDEILRINQCGHDFHSRCLVTWFLKEKQKETHDCPICRVQYYPAYKPLVRKQEQENNITNLRDYGFPPLSVW